jgi:DNA-binding MarR family transcriptional regulator
MELKALRERIRLTPFAFGKLLGRLQQEYLVEVVSGLERDEVSEIVQLTDRGESVLVSMLERTCEIPELH